MKIHSIISLSGLLILSSCDLSDPNATTVASMDSEAIASSDVAGKKACPGNSCGGDPGSTSYKALNLGALSGAIESTAYDINDGNQIVGDAKFTSGGLLKATMWTVSSTGALLSFEQLEAIPGFLSRAEAVNSSGQVVGAIWESLITMQPFVWTDGSGLTELTIPDGSCNGVAYDINDSGFIVGYAEYCVCPCSQRGILWTVDESGTETSMTVLEGLKGGVPLGINNNGDIVGFSTSGAFVWTSTGGASIVAGDNFGSMAMSISDEGEVVGTIRLPNKYPRGFSWTEAAGLDVLSTLGIYAGAYDVNDSGLIVGASSGMNTQKPPKAVYWENKVLVTLPASSKNYNWTEAQGVNESGAVVGFGYGIGAGHTAVLWMK